MAPESADRINERALLTDGGTTDMKGSMGMAIAAAIVAIATPVAAQEGTPVDPAIGAGAETQADSAAADSAATAANADVQILLAEAHEIQQRLIEVQQQVFSDPELADQRQALCEQVQAAMIEADPELAGSLERIKELEPAMAQAQQAGDQERLRELVAEARAMETRFGRAQQQALADPTLQEKVLAFNARVEERLLAIEPEAPRLIERLQELQIQLRGMSGS